MFAVLKVAMFAILKVCNVCHFEGLRCLPFSRSAMFAILKSAMFAILKVCNVCREVSWSSG